MAGANLPAQAYAVVVSGQADHYSNYAQSASLAAATLEKAGVYTNLLLAPSSDAFQRALINHIKLARRQGSVVQLIVYFAGVAHLLPENQAAVLQLQDKAHTLDSRTFLPGTLVYHTTVIIDSVDAPIAPRRFSLPTTSFPRLDTTAIRAEMNSLATDSLYNAQCMQWVVLSGNITTTFSQALNTVLFDKIERLPDGLNSITMTQIFHRVSHILEKEIIENKCTFNQHKLRNGLLKTTGADPNADHYWFYPVFGSTVERISHLRQQLPPEVSDLGGRILDTILCLPWRKSRLPYRVLKGLLKDESDVTLQTTLKQLIACRIVVPCLVAGQPLRPENYSKACLEVNLPHWARKFRSELRNDLRRKLIPLLAEMCQTTLDKANPLLPEKVYAMCNLLKLSVKYNELNYGRQHLKSGPLRRQQIWFLSPIQLAELCKNLQTGEEDKLGEEVLAQRTPKAMLAHTAEAFNMKDEMCLDDSKLEKIDKERGYALSYSAEQPFRVFRAHSHLYTFTSLNNRGVEFEYVIGTHESKPAIWCRPAGVNQPNRFWKPIQLTLEDQLLFVARIPYGALLVTTKDIFTVGYDDLENPKPRKLTLAKFAAPAAAVSNGKQHFLIDFCQTNEGGYLYFLDELSTFRLYKITNPKPREPPLLIEDMSKVVLPELDVRTLPAHVQIEGFALRALHPRPIFAALVLNRNAATKALEPCAFIAIRASSTISLVTAVQHRTGLLANLPLPFVVHTAILHEPNTIIAFDRHGSMHLIRYNPSLHTFSQPLVVPTLRHPALPTFLGRITLNGHMYYLAQFLKEVDPAKVAIAPAKREEVLTTLIFSPPVFSMDRSIAEMVVYKLPVEVSRESVPLTQLQQINPSDFVGYFGQDNAVGQPSVISVLSLKETVEKALHGARILAASASALGQFVHAPLGRFYDVSPKFAISLLATKEMKFLSVMAEALRFDNPRKALARFSEYLFLRYHEKVPVLAPSPLASLLYSLLSQLVVSASMMPGTNNSNEVHEKLSFAVYFIRYSLKALSTKLPAHLILQWELATLVSFMDRNVEALALADAVLASATQLNVLESLPQVSILHQIFVGRATQFRDLQEQTLALLTKNAAAEAASGEKKPKFSIFGGHDLFRHGLGSNVWWTRNGFRLVGFKDPASNSATPPRPIRALTQFKPDPAIEEWMFIIAQGETIKILSIPTPTAPPLVVQTLELPDFARNTTPCIAAFYDTATAEWYIFVAGGKLSDVDQLLLERRKNEANNTDEFNQQIVKDIQLQLKDKSKLRAVLYAVSNPTFRIPLTPSSSHFASVMSIAPFPANAVGSANRIAVGFDDGSVGVFVLSIAGNKQTATLDIKPHIFPAEASKSQSSKEPSRDLSRGNNTSSTTSGPTAGPSFGSGSSGSGLYSSAERSTAAITNIDVFYEPQADPAANDGSTVPAAMADANTDDIPIAGKGLRIVASTQDGRLRVYDTDSGRLLRLTKERAARVVSCIAIKNRFNFARSLRWSNFQEKTVFEWETIQQGLFCTLYTIEYPCYALAYSRVEPNPLMVGLIDNSRHKHPTLRVWRNNDSSFEVHLDHVKLGPTTLEDCKMVATSPTAEDLFTNIKLLLPPPLEAKAPEDPTAPKSFKPQIAPYVEPRVLSSSYRHQSIFAFTLDYEVLFLNSGVPSFGSNLEALFLAEMAYECILRAPLTAKLDEKFLLKTESKPAEKEYRKALLDDLKDYLESRPLEMLQLVPDQAEFAFRALEVFVNYHHPDKKHTPSYASDHWFRRFTPWHDKVEDGFTLETRKTKSADTKDIKTTHWSPPLMRASEPYWMFLARSSPVFHRDGWQHARAAVEVGETIPPSLIFALSQTVPYLTDPLACTDACRWVKSYLEKEAKFLRSWKVFDLSRRNGACLALQDLNQRPRTQPIKGGKRSKRAKRAQAKKTAAAAASPSEEPEVEEIVDTKPEPALVAPVTMLDTNKIVTALAAFTANRKNHLIAGIGDGLMHHFQEINDKLVYIAPITGQVSSINGIATGAKSIFSAAGGVCKQFQFPT